MRKLVSLALTGLAAVALLFSLIGMADAGGYARGGWGWHGGGGCYNCGWHPQPSVNFNFGFAGPVYPAYPAYPVYPYAYYAPPPPPPPVYPVYPVSATQAHVQWCRAQYQTYNPANNTFIGYDGRAYACVGPY